MTDEETLARLLCRLHFDRREWRGACPKAERTAWLVEKYWPQWRDDAAVVIRATSKHDRQQMLSILDGFALDCWVLPDGSTIKREDGETDNDYRARLQAGGRT